jgi:hypothetical protein
MLGKDQETPENHALSVRRGFFYRLVRRKRKNFVSLRLKND